MVRCRGIITHLSAAKHSGEAGLSPPSRQSCGEDSRYEALPGWPEGSCRGDRDPANTGRRTGLPRTAVAILTAIGQYLAATTRVGRAQCCDPDLLHTFRTPLLMPLRSDSTPTPDESDRSSDNDSTAVCFGLPGSNHTHRHRALLSETIGGNLPYASRQTPRRSQDRRPHCPGPLSTRGSACLT